MSELALGKEPAAGSQPASTRDRAEPKEFGGAIGALAIVGFSHLLVYYLWASITFYRGAAFGPSSIADLGPFLGRLATHFAERAMPSWTGAGIYFGFLLLQFAFAWLMPGPAVKGLPVPSEGGRQHVYLCNGAWSWWTTLALAAVLQITGVFPLSTLADHYGEVLTVAVMVANLVAIVVYADTLRRGTGTRLTGDHVYDFFAGAVLNPRVGRVDLKFFAEIRISWILLFFLTASAAAREVELRGELSGSMIFMLVAHGLYTNACMKGEECIPTTWDVFHEKWGWMLVFWNLVGVPFVYAFNSYYVLVSGPIELPPGLLPVLFVALFCAYYVWDTSQSQRNRFRMKQRGTFIRRHTFPQLPWGTLEDPKYLETANGGTLLVDGWWKYARKIHYTADIVMAFTWALACGFGGVLPYVYPAFFLGMILHRAGRDEARCRQKYGEDWARYLRTVPHRFIPFVY